MALEVALWLPVAADLMVEVSHPHTAGQVSWLLKLVELMGAWCGASPLPEKMYQVIIKQLKLQILLLVLGQLTCVK